MVHPRYQTPRGEPVANRGAPLLISLSVICKFDIKEAHSVFPNPLLKKECPWAETSKGGG